MPAVQVDKNLIVKTTIEKEGIKFYNIDEEPFKIYGVWKEGDRYYRVPSDVAEATSKNLVQKHFQIDENGIVTIPQRPGLGIEIDEEVLAYYRVD